MWRRENAPEQTLINEQPEPAPLADTADVENLPSIDQPRQLVLLTQAQQALAQATSLDEIKDIRDKAEAARKYVESAQLGLSLQNHAAEIKLRAERRAGELLAELKLAGGDRRSTVAGSSLTLEELGISKHQSSRWQREAAVPEDVFERFLREINDSSAELTSAALLRIAREFQTKRAASDDDERASFAHEAVYESLASLRAAGQQFGCLYADPPLLGEEEADAFGRSAVTIEQLVELPIAELLLEEAHVHLWVGSDWLAHAPSVFSAWGLEYCSSFVWVKPQGATGRYWRMSHDFLLLGVKGSLPFRNRSLTSWLRANRMTHGRKPERVRRAIQEVSPGPYLELFARKPMKGWTVCSDGFQK